MITEAEVESLFLQRVRDYVVEDRKNELHLTDLVSPCPRKLWFEKHIDVPEDPDALLRLWWGKVAHEMPLLKHHELKLEYNGVLTSIDEYEDGVLIEKKTADFVPNTSAELQRYYSHYIEQLNLEALLLNMNGYEVKQGFLLFIKFGAQEERGRKPVKAFDLTSLIDLDRTAQTFDEKVSMYKALLSKDSPPPRPANFAFFDYPCSYCKFRGWCLCL